MPPRQATNAATRIPARPLPPLPKLRIKNPNQRIENPCVAVMSAVLGCWASSGQAAAGCAQLEESLRACMDAPRPKNQSKNTINYHLSRMYPKIIGPHKRK